MSAKKARIFVPLTKVDQEERLVYGRITQEILDKSGEVMDYESSKPNFEKWSNDIHEASGGLSKGNLRVMHGPHVAGKIVEMDFNDDEKAIDVCAKVVDDNEWEKVITGCYTGFSVGGNYGKRWTEADNDNPLKKIKKFEAKPNEASLVDNPCVPTATFSMTKADGSVEQVAFKVENDDEAWPAFSKAEAMEVENKEIRMVKTTGVEPTASEIATKAGELAKAAGDGTTWQDHIQDAREALMKADKETPDEGGAGDENEEEDKKKKKAGDNQDETSEQEDTATDKTEKVTPAGVKQVWRASDGETFDKKEECVAHEATLNKTELTEAEKLKARLTKAITAEPEKEQPSILSLDRVEDLHKAVCELELPREEDGSPKLEKGMYTVSRFANMLGDVAGLARTIQAEGKLEGDAEDASISKTLTSQLGSFGESFMSYAKQQVAELVAGLDLELAPRAAYDYYYRAAGEGNDLAKHVVELIEAVEDERETAEEKLTKFASVEEAPAPDEMTPTLKKRFDDLEAQREEFKKIAEDAVSAIEDLRKEVKDLADTPLPRAPANVALKEGDGLFFGKAVTTDEERVALLKNMIENEGPEGMALRMIKAAHASGGHQLSLQPK